MWAAAMAMVLTGCLEGQPRDHVPPAEQKALPTARFRLGEELCPAKYIPARLANRWRTRAIREYKALRVALRDHPNDFVTASAVLSDPEPDEDRIHHEEITIRDLARTHMQAIHPRDRGVNMDLEGGPRGRCLQKLRSELVRLINLPHSPD
jgi:hypothetical protein